MADEEQWSPKCPKCGTLTNRVVVPAPNQIFAGRLSPRALQGHMGQRERCPRCATWFPLAEGTQWVKRSTPFSPKRPEGTDPDAEPGPEA